jgi:hypothetical protein
VAHEPSGARSVAVGGDVRSSIIVTGDNVNLEVRLEDVDGALLERLASRDAPEPVALPRPLDSRPPRYANHVDREAEAVAALVGAAKVGAVNVYGEPGIGKTHVLSNAAHRPEADELPDGVVFVPADGAALDDVLQALFEEFYDCGEPPVRPSRGRLRRSLSDHEALVVVDGLKLDREGGQALVAAAPGCRFVAASTERCLWDAQAIRLEGLEPDSPWRWSSRSSAARSRRTNGSTPRVSAGRSAGTLGVSGSSCRAHVTRDGRWPRPLGASIPALRSKR